MYNELPHTGIGAGLLTVVALALVGSGILLRVLGRRPKVARG